MDSYPLEISVEEAARLLHDGTGRARLIDVREPGEHALCRIEGALLIPMREIPAALPSLPRDKHLLIQCHHGSRSLRVTHWLRAQGMNSVSNIAGGIDAWSREIDPSIPRY